MTKQVILVLMGEGAVGKSCITTRYVNNEFLDYYDPTIQDSFRKTVTIDTEPVVVEILDTAGQEEYASLNESFIMKGNGFLLVYSIIESLSLERLEVTVNNIYKLREINPESEKLPIVVCGNKCDREIDRQVSKEGGAAFAAKYHAEFFESNI